MLTIMMGYPGSGKSTEAQRIVDRDFNDEYSHTVRVNRDDIRQQLFGRDAGQLSKSHEEVVSVVEHAMVTSLLEDDQSVIVDATNLHPAALNRWKSVAYNRGHGTTTIHVLTDVEECVRRDSLRERKVGREVIESFAARFPMGTWAKNKNDKHGIHREVKP